MNDGRLNDGTLKNWQIKNAFLAAVEYLLLREKNLRGFAKLFRSGAWSRIIISNASLSFLTLPKR